MKRHLSINSYLMFRRWMRKANRCRRSRPSRQALPGRPTKESRPTTSASSRPTLPRIACHGRVLRTIARTRYELLARYLEAFVKNRGRAPVFHELTLIALIPNGKADFNNNGPFSTDYIGKNYGYPEGSYGNASAAGRIMSITSRASTTSLLTIHAFPKHCRTK